MSTQIQFRRGTTAQTAAFTGALGEVTVDTQNHVPVVHDGVTLGGFPAAGLSATQTIYNKTIPVIAGVTTVTGNLVANSAVASTSNSTGALVVVGGAGISGNLYVGGNLQVTGTVTYNNIEVVGTTEYVNTIQATNVYAATIGNSAALLTATTGVVANFSSGNVYMTGGASASTLVATNFSTANAQITGGTVNFTTAGATTGNFGTVTTAVLNNTSGNITNLGGTTAVYTNLSSGNIQSSGAHIPTANATVGLGSASAYWGTFYSATATHNSISVAGQGITSGGNVAVTSTIYGQGLYDNGNRVLSTSSGAGNLAISTTAVTLPATGPGAASVGSSTAIPVITTDVYGRISSTSTAAVIAPAGTLSGSILNSGVTASSLTSVGTLTGLTVSGAIVPNANASVNLGSTSAWWNIMYGTAIHAQYADLAEKYQADAEYAPGTVLVFGGTAEVTTTTVSHDTAVAGIVSTDPAYVMNGGLTGTNIAVLGLTGRVPCQVQGPVNKGDVLVTSTTAGVAERIDNARFAPGCVVGKALETITTNTIETIEVVVGRF